jgi:hypothetical protein
MSGFALRSYYNIASHAPTSSSSSDFVALVSEDEPTQAALIQAAFAYRDLPCTVHVT